MMRPLTNYSKESSMVVVRNIGQFGWEAFWQRNGTLEHFRYYKRSETKESIERNLKANGLEVQFEG